MDVKFPIPTVKLTDGGPYLVENCLVYAADGTLLKKNEKCALCACGKTKNPSRFCDGSHLNKG